MQVATRRVDLHTHTNCSDGIYAPVDLVRLASNAGLQAIAIADHDSVAGIEEARAAGDELGVEVVPAVELSVSFQHFRDVHLLGYWIDYHDVDFLLKLAHFRKRRETRGQRIVENINQRLLHEGKSAVPLTRVTSDAKGALGRPHIARVLVEMGHAADMQDAFKRYLEPCDVPKEYLPLPEAIAEIQRIGGVSVLAHPQSITRDRQQLRQIIRECAMLGLQGLEAINSMGMDDDSYFLQRLAANHGLCVTGGSDFHGGEDDFTIGSGRNDLWVDYSLLQELKDRRPAR
jgi:predicted metal-dependent phosphoesterase TrpH